MKSVIVDSELYYRWKKGEHIQNVFPEMSRDDREFMISGWTVPEWDHLFAYLDEEE
jgi:hypothetical protein